MLLKTNNFYEFGDFRLDLAERVLLRDGKFIPVTPKVFETLLVLVENAGRIIEKDELMREIWQDRFVEESNLTFNIKMLRKALGDDATNPKYVETVPRRGYRFIAEVERVAGDEFQTDNDYKIHSSNGHATNGHAVKSNGTNGLNGNFLGKNLTAEAPLAKTSTANGSRAVFYSSLAAILISVIAVGGFFLTRRQPTFYERFGAANNNSGILSGEKLSDSGSLVGLNISPDGKLLVYNSQENGKNVIWLRQLASGVSVPLLTTTPDENIVSASFSDTGEYVLYTHQRKGERLTLSRVSTLGGVPSVIVRGLHNSYSFSPDKQQIAFERSDEQGTKLMISDADGRNERQVFLSPKPRYLFGVKWSPDGKSIAYCISGGGIYGGSQTDYGIYEHDLETNEEKPISAVKWNNLENLMWLPDKSGLLVTGRQRLESVDQIWRVAYPSGEAVPITDDSADLAIRSAAADFTRILASQVTLISNVWVAPRNDLSNARVVGKAVFDAAWSPDGEIIYQSKGAMKTDIWLTSADGANTRQITAGDPLERSPEMSSDGRYIVYVSTQNSRQNIWRMNANGTNQIQLTSGDGEIFPVITPDGKSVVYVSNKDRSLWRVSIEGGDVQQLSAKSHRRVGISPDGTKLAHISRANGKPQLLVETFPECAPLQQFDVGIVNDAGSIRIVWAKDGKSVIYPVNDAAFIGNLWQQSLDGGAAQKITDFTSERIFDFAVSPDESQIAFVRGNWNFDAVLLKGFK